MEEEHSGKITPCFARYPGVDQPRRARRLAAVAVGKAQALAIDGLGSAGSLASVAAESGGEDEYRLSSVALGSGLGQK